MPHRRLPATNAALVSLIGAFVLALMSLASAPPAAAHDDDHHRIGGDKLKMSAPVTKPAKRKFQFKARRQLAINDLSDDPSIVGASLLVRGTGASDGSTGLIYLDVNSWRPLGTKGWKYKADARYAAAYGVKKIIIKTGTNGGSLQITAKGSFWDYDIIAAQQTVQVVLTIGPGTYCAEFANFTRNESGRVQSSGEAPPLECPAVCGNGILELPEECDDGNRDDSDTCSNQCMGCLPQNVEYTSTFEALQALIFDSPVYQCSSDVCHGSGLQGGLDLRAGASWAGLVNVPSQIAPATMRVFPGDQDLSLVYTKIASKTLGSPAIPGTPMPSNPQTVSPALLEALRLWIRAGAPETNVVEGTAEFLDACLPPAGPNKMPQPDPPAFGSGAQFAKPAHHLGAQSETEVCIPSYYDLTAPGAVPAQYRVPCLGEFPGTNDHGASPGECFTYNRVQFAMDAQSHHLIVHSYAGDYDWNDAGWGAWRCYLGDNDGLPCTPTDADPCPGGGSCGGEARTGFACNSFNPPFGPPDYGFGFSNTARQFGGIQEPTAIDTFEPGVYARLPLKGVIVWNSHTFNATSQATDLEGWINIDFTADQTFENQVLFDTSYIFTQDVPAFEQREYCATHTFAEGSNLTDLNSHTHKWGTRFEIFGPPQTPCGNGGADPYGFFFLTDPNCARGNPGDLIYESFDYADPLQLKLTPTMVMSGTAAQRTIKFCALFDNGFTEPSEVKGLSTSPDPPTPFFPGGPCSITEVACMGGPNKGQLCFADDNQCPNSVCDACPLKGGVTSGDEMFIVFGSYYLN